MVSLSRESDTITPGATFFDDTTGTMEDREYLQPILDSFGVFRPLTTIPAFSLHFVYTLVLEILAIVYAIIHPDNTHKCREYFIIIYVHVGLWFLTLIVDQVARMKHYSLRMHGYLEFYKKTQVHHRLPLYVVSLWSVVILFVNNLMQHFYPDNFAEKCIQGGTLSPISYLCAIITVEFCLITHINISYILKVRKFNKQKAPPDVQKDEWNACSEPDTFAEGEVGYRQFGDKVFDLLEKQADLIRHLKDHNARLGEKLLVLNAQIQQNRNRTDIN